ncbi:MAG: HAMP domain-containing sensor histidine kinase [Gaiellales bacterium]
MAALVVVVAVRQISHDQRAASERALRSQATAVSDLLAKRQTHDLGTYGGGGLFLPDLLRATAAKKMVYIRYQQLPPGTTAIGLTTLPASYATLIDWGRLGRSGATQTFEIRLPSSSRTYLAVAAPLRLRSGPISVTIGAVVLARPSDELSTSALSLARRLTPAVLVVLFVIALLLIFLSRRLTRPVRELSEASERVALGQYDIELQSKGRDELGQLAAGFERMAHKLRESDEHERNFLMRISHELRTPLTAIQGHVQLIADGMLDDPDEQQASLEVVLVEADRLQRLIGDLLDLAKLEARRFSLNREHVDLDALCAHAVHSRAAAALTASVELRSKPADRPVIVLGDGDRLLQIVGNLIANALRWTPPGGEVVVSLREERGLAIVDVDDSGPGVPVESRELIFRPFVSQDVQGTGLGLAVASELATVMGGELRVTDGPRGGARFTLELPLLRAGADVPVAQRR